jgi:hypothetical protein
VQGRGSQVALPQLDLVEHLNQGGGIGAAAADFAADGRLPREPGLQVPTSRLNASNSPIADLV